MTGRVIPDPGFPLDMGSATPAVAAALTAYAAGAGSYVDALAAVQTSRLLVPVVAVLGEGEVDHDDPRGLARDKTSEMATVLLQGADGRLALLAFTSTDTLRAWDPVARPVPVTARTAAEAALQDGAAALLVDIAGPASLIVEGEDLTGLAAGWTLTRVGGRSAWLAGD